MFTCPDCKVSLKIVKGIRGVFWICPTCDGRSVSLPLLRKDIEPLVLNEMWSFAKSGDFPRNRSCPACHKWMAEVPVKIEGGSQNLDICTLCQFIWFDMGEYSAMPSIKIESKVTNNIKDENKPKLTFIKTDSLKYDSSSIDSIDFLPEESWHWLPGFLGMPVEVDSKNLKTTPWVTWGIATLVIFFSLIAFMDPENTFRTYAMIPAKFDPYAGLTLFTSFFLHAGILHLVGNMYFFLAFGDNVEDWLGKKRFLLLIVFATLFGHILHILNSPQSDIPCVGASGGISGILAFYALQFPHAKLSLLLFRTWFKLPAYLLFVFWIMIQIWGSAQQISGHGHVSYLAHIGGVCIGVFFWLLTRKNWFWIFDEN